MMLGDFFSIKIDGKEMDCYQFLDSFSEDTFDEKWIDWDDERQMFIANLYDRKFILTFPGTIDEYIVNKVKELVRRYRGYKEKERIIAKVKETGVFPKDKKERFYYKEYLEEELDKAKASLASCIASATAAVSFGALALCFGKIMGNGAAGALTSDLQFYGGLLGCVVSSTGFFSTLPYLADSNIKEKFNEYRILKDNLRSLENYDESLDINNGYVEFVKQEDKKDNKRVEVYKDKFLEEARDIADLIDSLPKERQKVYRDKVSLLIKEYQDKVNALIEKNKHEIVLGEAEDVWQIFVDLLPELNKIRFDIQEELDVISEKEKFNDEVESFQKSLYNSYTDELTDSPVAHMKLG